MVRTCDIAIIGAGLAGLSAAVTCGRMGRSTLVFSRDVPGGELLKIEQIDGVPGYPDPVAGYDLCPIAQEQADALGVAFEMEEVTALAADGDRWRLTSDSGEVLAGAVIVASGTAIRPLDLPGEAAFHGLGVSECASCDGPLLRGKVAVVAGGGDSAMQEALVLARHVRQVILLVRGAALDGQAVYRKAIVAEPRISIRFETVPTEICGDTGVTHVNVRSADGAEDRIEADAIFNFTGLMPNSAVVADLLTLDDTGRIPVDAEMRSAMRGLLAAGNVRSGSPHRAAGAMGDGASAALAADRFLTTGNWPGQ